MAEDPNFQPNQNFKSDVFNVVVGVIWQTSLVILPIYLVLQEGVPIAITAAIAIVSSLVLKRTWYDALPKGS